MNSVPNDNFADRQRASSVAKQALLEKMRPKAAATDPLFDQREAMRKAELAQVRQDRADTKAAVREAAAAAEAARLEAQAAAEQAALDAKRGERKERKQLTKVEAKAKRDARYAARKARK